MPSTKKWRIHNHDGSKRVVVTKELPGTRWLEILEGAGCRVELCTSEDVLGIADIKAAIGHRCDGAIGQLTEAWGDELFSALKDAGARVYSNYAVGFNNVDIAAATRHGIQERPSGFCAGATLKDGCRDGLWASGSTVKPWVSSVPAGWVRPMAV